MSEQDRQKWNSRYAAGAYEGRRHPSELLLQALAEFAPTTGRALDVACGAGRNALHLASLGFEVDAVDISSEALKLGRQHAADADLSINWMERDLSSDPGFTGRYDLIVMVRFVNQALLHRLVDYLAPGGVLVVEQHLRCDVDVIGPRNPRFRVEPGELESAVRGLDVLRSEEGVTRDPDDRPVAIARLIAQRQWM